LIISHKYQYIYVELPLTGSTAIANELIEHYDGQSILFKHATYLDFLKIAQENEKKYFVFSSIRHPLDQWVSRYLKLKNDHQQMFSNPEPIKKNRGRLRLYIQRPLHQWQFSFIKNQNADFFAFLQKFYFVPYSNWSELNHKEFNFLIRFEHLQSDFTEVLKLLNLTQVRPLPIKNRTVNKSNDFFSFYSSPALQRFAINRTKVFCKKWNYHFPKNWPSYSINLLDVWYYEVVNFIRKIYWKYIR
jgi:hypothetical protein